MKAIHQLAGILLLSVVWMLPSIAQEPAGSGRYDQEIQAEATKILNSKDRWKTITATVDDGIVLLQGTAKVYIDKLDAGKKVGKIKHAEGVRNHVEVTTTVPDAQLEDTLANKLRYDRVFQGIMFNNLGLKVENGVVTVTGDVIDYPSRDSALAIAENTPGVKDVVDDINVLPTSQFDDDLRIRIARAIYGHPVLRKYGLDPQKPIRIVVQNGHVTLYGVVDSAMDKQIAEVQAKSVPNVFSVDNQLVVPAKSK